jgi:hypothetical protein
LAAECGSKTRFHSISSERIGTLDVERSGIDVRVDFKWNPDAVEQVKREAVTNLQRRLDSVRCPVHGTGVRVEGLQRTGEPVLDEPCCEELTKAIKKALS